MANATGSTIIITGGAGFIGSHLVEWHLKSGWHVYVVDDLSTGSLSNLEEITRGSPDLAKKLLFKESDAASKSCAEEILREVENRTLPPVRAVALLASPASPDHFVSRPLDCLRAGAQAVDVWLDVAVKSRAKVLFASTSEVYVDPEVHPQKETYLGNVNSLGVRGCYDEAKRYGEALCAAYHRQYGLDVRIARIFNTYGPRMPRDGRVMPKFVEAVLSNRPLVIHGTGEQTRSVCYIDDTIRGLTDILYYSGSMGAQGITAINVGSEEEITIMNLAKLGTKVVGSNHPEIEYREAREGDPKQRRPDLSRLKEIDESANNLSATIGISRTGAWAAKNGWGK